MDNGTEARCKYCDSGISAAAKKCPECGSYQNIMSSIFHALPLIAICVSAILYIGNTIYGIYLERNARDGISVIDYRSASHFIALNTGDNDLFIKNLKGTIELNGINAFTYVDINSRVAKSDVFSLRIPPKHPDKGYVSSHGIVDNEKYFINVMTEATLYDKNGNCLFFTTYTEKNDQYKDIKESIPSGRKLVQKELNALLTVISIPSNTTRKYKVKLVAVLSRVVTPECDEFIKTEIPHFFPALNTPLKVNETTGTVW